MINNKGFTLMELLAVIIILAFIATISIAIGTSIIKKSKDKTYSVTINEIENTASNYLTETNDISFSIDQTNNFEYKYITIQDLIDYGYLKNDIIGKYVNDDEKISATDCIYVKRNINSKAVEQINYNKSCNQNDNYCSIIENFASITIEQKAGEPVSKQTNLVNVYVCD